MERWAKKNKNAGFGVKGKGGTGPQWILATRVDLKSNNIKGVHWGNAGRAQRPLPGLKTSH